MATATDLSQLLPPDDFGAAVTGGQVSDLTGFRLVTWPDGTVRRVLVGTDGNDVFHLAGVVQVDGRAGYDVVTFDRPTEGIHLNFGKVPPSFVAVEAFVGSRFADTFSGAGADDDFSGAGGNDRLSGADGHDRLRGNAGSDSLSGGRGDDGLAGGSGHDWLSGGSGRDHLSGGSGNDRLAGGAGADVLTGGSGADRFLFRTPEDSAPGAADLIRDFSRAEGDRIDLRALDANDTLAGDQSFTFIGSAAWSGTAGELRTEVSAGGRTHVGADLDGDGRSDFRLVLSTPVALDAGDFLL